MDKGSKGARFKWQDGIVVGVFGAVLAVAAMPDMPIDFRLGCFAACAIYLPIAFFSYKTWPRPWRFLLSVAVVVFIGYVAWNAWQASRPKMDVFLEWKQPAPMEFGTSLTDHQLNSVAKIEGVEVPGTYIYTPTFGSTLPAGMDTISVEFTPRDPSRFNPAKGAIVVLVKPDVSVPPISKAKSSSSQRRTINKDQHTGGFGSPIFNGDNNTNNTSTH